MKITRYQLRKIIRETLLTEIGDGTGESAIEAFIVDELLQQDTAFTMEDIIQQAEGAGFDSEETEEVLQQLLDTEVVKEENDEIVVT